MDTSSTDGTFDISNLDRLGQSEVELVQKVVDGVELLVKVCQVMSHWKSEFHLLMFYADGEEARSRRSY